VGTYGPCYQQLARAPAAPEASAPSSVELDAVADQAISACSGDARTTVKGLIAAKDFLGVRLEEQGRRYRKARGRLQQFREIKDAPRGRICRSTFCSSKLAHSSDNWLRGSVSAVK